MRQLLRTSEPEGLYSPTRIAKLRCLCYNRLVIFPIPTRFLTFLSAEPVNVQMGAFLMNDRVGQQLGNYQLTRLLGEGGFAEVYLGEHIYLGTLAAIKVMNTRLTSEDIESFRIEARTIANLVHPNIVRVLEFGVDNGNP